MTGKPLGPFQAERDAAGHPAVRAIYDGVGVGCGRGMMREGNHRLLGEVLSAAGVELGGYDHRIVSWLAGWEPRAVAVIAGWVGRAHQAGLNACEPRTAAALAAPDAPAVEMLRAAADALAVDLALWKARDPAAPSPEARRARRRAIATADAVITVVSRLRAGLEGGGRP
jgi:hypothetical protein